MSSNKQISVIGGTGNLGVPIVKNLVGFGYEVKLIVRDVQKAKKIFDNYPDIQIVDADLNDVAALKIALLNTSYLYLNLSTQTTDLHIPFAAEREGVANILKVVNHEQIKQIILISGLGAFNGVKKPGDFEFIPNTIRKQGHKLIKDSGIPYTILHCSWFADSFRMYSRGNVYTVIGNTTSPIYFTNCYNFSVHLANAIGNSDAMFKEFPLQGDSGYTHPDAARKFLSIFSEKMQISILPRWIIALMAHFNNEMKYVKHMSDYFHASSEEFLADDYDTYKVLGKPVLSLMEYAEKLRNEIDKY